MTTIAVRDGVMAADSLVVDGATVVGQKCKVAELPCGFLGLAGAALALNDAAYWLRDFPVVNGEAPKSLEGALGLLLTKDGDVFQIENGPPYKMDAEFFAVGSGSQIALGAMAMGASAKKAVKLASKFDTSTGGKVSTYGDGA